MLEVRDHLKKCKYCNRAAIFDVAMRHGAEYPGCVEHISTALTEAYQHDRDYGHVDVYQIGVNEATVKDPRYA